MIDRTIACLICIAAVALCGCSGPLFEGNIPLPPEAVPYAPAQNERIDPLLAGFDQTVHRMLAQRHYEVRAQQMYTTTLTVDRVTAFYASELPKRGWEPVNNLAAPASHQAVLAYRKGEQLLLIAALDTRPYHGPGVVIYTLQAKR